jgi:orotate phosphoribosyltransferase
MSGVSPREHRLAEVLRQRGVLRLDEAVQLASGDWSRHFVDAKRALAGGRDLRLAGEALADLVAAEVQAVDAVGGMTMGADPLAHAVAIASDVEWFAVRKQAKERGTKRRIEGAVLGPGRRVLVVDDVVTRGGSLLEAFEAVRATGATVVAAVALVDRGGFDPEPLTRHGAAYRALLTHADVGIPAVGTEPAQSSRGSQA